MATEPETEPAARPDEPCPEGRYVLGMPAHAVHVFLGCAAVVLLLVVFQQILVPDSFGEVGFYDSDAITANQAYPIHYRSAAACEACHEEQFAAWGANGHKVVTCETCHGPAGDHVEADIEPRPAITTDQRPELCLYCHRKVTGRADSIVQIESLEWHVEDQDEDLETAEGKCITCHDDVHAL